MLYGPPGSGKTSIAEAIASETGAHCVRINAVLSNSSELRDLLRIARLQPERKTLLFIDEIHRFNKAQQDLLLPDVEAGNIRLIGATTHNPGFYVNPPLLSRSHLFKLEALSMDALVSLARRALEDSERGLAARNLQVDDAALKRLAAMADGDARRVLNALETLANGLPVGAGLTEDHLANFARERQIRYDKNEDDHYDTASAFIKSMRGGNPDAALYWLVKMLEGGEDPRFIARRMIILASEDIGLADARALPLALACAEACERVGLPEAELTLAHVTVFLACSPKSNATTTAIGKVRKHIREEGLQPVPLHLRDGHTALNKSLSQGKDYRYSHLFPEAISGQDYMENPVSFLELGSAGEELRIRERLQRWQQLRRQLRSTTNPE